LAISFANVSAIEDLEQPLRKLEKKRGKRLIIDPIDHGFNVASHQPTRRTIGILDDLQRKHRGVVNRFHLPVDFGFKTQSQAAEFADWLARHVVMKRRARGEMKDFAEADSGIYWIAYHGDDRPPVNLALYHDRPSKLDGQPCAHPELRLEGAAVCGRNGIRFASDVFNIDPATLYATHLWLSDIGDRYCLDMIRATVANDIARHREHPPAARSARIMERMDRNRARIRFAAASCLRRARLDRAENARWEFDQRTARTSMKPFELDLPHEIELFAD
jgi:hypothetical protein